MKYTFHKSNLFEFLSCFKTIKYGFHEDLKKQTNRKYRMYECHRLDHEKISIQVCTILNLIL